MLAERPEGVNRLRLRAHLGSLAHELCDALFPPRCAVCDARAGRSGFECDAHRLPLGDLAAARCGRCASRLPSFALDGEPCARCRAAPLRVRPTLVLSDYSDAALREWILTCKHRGRAELGEVLGRALGRSARDRDPEPGLLVPVPLHWLRRLERGHDQAAGIARGLARELRFPLLNALRRVRYTTPQGTPGAVSRRANVHGALCVRRASGARVRDARVWLVDDVLKSGATLSECARVLRAAGARSVGALIVARATPGPGPEPGSGSGREGVQGLQ